MPGRSSAGMLRVLVCALAAAMVISVAACRNYDVPRLPSQIDVLTPWHVGQGVKVHGDASAVKTDEDRTSFLLTEESSPAQVRVDFEGDLPRSFREGAHVIVSGRLDETAAISADDVLVRLFGPVDYSSVSTYEEVTHDADDRVFGTLEDRGLTATIDASATVGSDEVVVRMTLTNNRSTSVKWTNLILELFPRPVLGEQTNTTSGIGLGGGAGEIGPVNLGPGESIAREFRWTFGQLDRYDKWGFRCAFGSSVADEPSGQTPEIPVLVAGR